MNSTLLTKFVLIFVENKRICFSPRQNYYWDESEETLMKCRLIFVHKETAAEAAVSELLL